MSSSEANKRYRARKRGEPVPLLRKTWTAHEDVRITQVYFTLKRGDGQMIRLAMELECSVDKIQGRASTLGLTKPDRRFSQSARTKFSQLGVERMRTEPETMAQRRGGHGGGTAGYRADLGGKYFRSAWEANYARFLTFTHVRWEYESKTFWFEKIRRGVRSYTPDFHLPDEGVYHEVKGWMDSKSQTKLKRMKKYYPGENVIVVDREFFKAANRQGLCRLIPYWECRHTSHQVGYVPYVQSEETKARRSEAMKGKVKTAEHRANLSAARIGVAPWNKGKAWSLAIRAKIRESWVRRKAKH